MEIAPALPVASFADIGDGLRVHYHAVGPEDGAPLVFLHGSGPGASGYSNFQDNFGFFGEGGFRTYVPDALGYGRSSMPADAKYTLDYLVEGTRRWLDAIGVERASFIGNSMGGAMAIRFALLYPERVDKLVLMAPGGLEEREVYMGMRGIRRMIKAFFSPEGITRDSMRRVFELQLFDGSLVTDQIIEERFQIAELQPKAVMSTSKVPNQAGQLSELTCPVFAWWGLDDQFCPVSGADTILRSVKGARVMNLAQCGHWVMVEHRDVFNRLSVDFLRES